MIELNKVRKRRETIRILEKRNSILKQEMKERQRLCDQQVSSCLADKAVLLMRGQKKVGLICPEIEHRILNGVENRHPYDLVIEGALIRSYFSFNKSLNPNNLPVNEALESWCVLYGIDFQYDSCCDTYRFSKNELRTPQLPQSQHFAWNRLV